MSASPTNFRELDLVRLREGIRARGVASDGEILLEPGAEATIMMAHLDGSYYLEQFTDDGYALTMFHARPEQIELVRP